MNNVIHWFARHAIDLAIAIWFISSLFDISGILFSVKHTDTETKVSIETPVKEQKQKATDPSTPQAEEGPKASW
jgi:hypothetical protein